MADLLPIAALTAPRDRFRCVPFVADISAATCLAHQRATYDGGRMRGHTPGKHYAHPACARCELGREVARRVGVVPAVVIATQPCVVCQAPVQGAKGREPRCPVHRSRKRIESGGVR